MIMAKIIDAALATQRPGPGGTSRTIVTATLSLDAQITKVNAVNEIQRRMFIACGVLLGAAKGTM